MFWKMVGRWALLAIAVPLAATVMRRWGQSIERRKGQTRMSALLRRAATGADTLTGRDSRRRLGART